MNGGPLPPTPWTNSTDGFELRRRNAAKIVQRVKE